MNTKYRNKKKDPIFQINWGNECKGEGLDSYFWAVVSEVLYLTWPWASISVLTPRCVPWLHPCCLQRWNISHISLFLRKGNEDIDHKLWCEDRDFKSHLGVCQSCTLDMTYMGSLVSPGRKTHDLTFKGWQISLLMLPVQHLFVLSCL